MDEPQREVEHWLLFGTVDVALDQDDRLLEHIICRACGYDLISMQKGQQCPECGSPVAISIRGDLLSYSHPDWTAHVGHHVRISGLLLMALPIVLVVVVFMSQPVSGILPAIILAAWSYAVVQATRAEPVQPSLTRHDLLVRYSAGAMGVLILLAFAALALKLPISGPGIFALASLTFLASLTIYLLWLSNLILRVPANDLCDTLRRRLWTVLALTVLVIVLVLTQAALGLFFVAAPAWVFYVLRVGYPCVQAGEIILCESRMARQNWLEREAMLDKEQRFRDPAHSPTTGGTSGIPTDS